MRASVRNSGNNQPHPVVGIIMGSDSDLPTMQQAADVCTEFGVRHEVLVLSAHQIGRASCRERV